MAPRKWPEATKALALAVYASEGGPTAEERTGVPAATIRTWARRTSQAIGRAEQTVTGSEVLVRSSAPWSERRAEAVLELGSLVHLALAKTRECFEADRLRDARDASVSLGILIDKAQLLAGGATGRTETFSLHANADDVREQIARLEEELGYS